MDTADYLIIVASINENMKLGEKIKAEFDRLELSSEIIDLVGMELPMFTSKAEAEDGIPEAIAAVAQKMQKAKAYIFVSPEYNYSIPPTLTNLIAWVSRIGEDFRVLFNEKPVLIATFSGGGGNDVLNAMRVQLHKLGAVVMPRQILANYRQPLNEKSMAKTIAQLIRFSS